MLVTLHEAVVLDEGEIGDPVTDADFRDLGTIRSPFRTRDDGGGATRFEREQVANGSEAAVEEEVPTAPTDRPADPSASSEGSEATGLIERLRSLFG